MWKCLRESGNWKNDTRVGKGKKYIYVGYSLCVRGFVSLGDLLVNKYEYRFLGVSGLGVKLDTEM